MPPAARLTDMHTCPMQTPGVPPIPHVGGPQVVGAPTVMICNMPAGQMGNQEVCVGPPDADLKCSSSVMICNKPANRLGDNSSHGGALVAGAPTVMIGG
jgi:uncharacterized Zn-binding protein involved in type VI secretion